MTLQPEERNHVKQVLQQQDPSELKQYLSEPVYNFLRKENNLKTIQDRVVFVNQNKFRSYESFTFTKFLTSEIDSVKVLNDLLSQLTPPFLCFVDFHFLYQAQNDQDLSKIEFKFQGASKISAMNTTMKITQRKYFNELMSEFKDMNNSDVLNSVAQHHSELYEYAESGLRPYRLLSLVVCVQKILRP